MAVSRLRSPVGVALMFATNGAAFSSILPWYPTFKAQWGLSDAVFGLIVACFAAGSLASTVLPSLAVNRFGPRMVVVTGTAVLAALVAVVGWSVSGLMLAVLLLAVGVLDAVIDVSQNVAAVRVQDRLGISVMSSMHAFWSLGAVLSGALGTAAAAGGVDVRVHLSAVALAVAALVVFAAWLTGPVGEGTDADPGADGDGSGSGTRRRGPGPGRLLVLALPVAVVATSGTVVEDVASNWAGIASVELAGTALGTAGVAFTVVLAAQTVGRFSGDWLIQRFGRVAAARSGGVFIALGGVVVVTATAAAPLYVGLALVGFGCATLVPSAFVAAARLPGLSEGAGVTVVSWLMRLGFLATSPVIGAVSSVTNLRWALGLLIVVGLLVVVTARALREPARVVERRDPDRHPDPGEDPQ
ncbi:MFS transporter [Corynebacterium halotolerans]|uniref:Transporter n=1 Tax=Corynebacterium halotolerans YIM 70093 = DSM 44683 TaxID=1121362 RepID=M1NL46_9CORY|nr:MFS transporter [Corynebacterium halotolerans]AGF72118.1 transporter [Corynebacterium halotolerans YIM 70093 = DSM 44683]